MLQKDGLICCRNKAKVLVRPKGIYYLALTQRKLDIPLKRTKLDRAFAFQLRKLLFKLNQLVQGIQYGFLEKNRFQGTSLLMNLTNRSCENMAILLERHPEYRNHRHVTKFKREPCFRRKGMWSWEFWHKPNSLTEDVCLNYGLGNTVKLRLVIS
jgi:hypothetical protein